MLSQNGRNNDPSRGKRLSFSRLIVGDIQAITSALSRHLSHGLYAIDKHQIEATVEIVERIVGMSRHVLFGSMCSQ